MEKKEATEDTFTMGRRAVMLARQVEEITAEGVFEPSVEFVFCEEGDIDPIATTKDWEVHPGNVSDEYVKKFISTAFEPHLFAANNAWPSDVPLPKAVWLRQEKSGPLRNNNAADSASPTISPG